MRITLAQLRLLLTVIEARSVGAAARRLGLTQSGVSQAIMALERALGMDLLARTRDGVTPTAFALSILADAEAASDAARRIECRARAAAAAPKRPLRIACVPSAACRLLPAWMRRFRHLHPQTELSVFEGHHIEVGEWVERGLADIGLAAITPEGLAAEHVRDEELIVVARREHPVLRAAAVNVGALTRETLVTAGLGCDPILERLFASAEAAMPAIIRTQDIATALAMVRQGLGLTILPDTAFPRTDMHDLRMRPLAPAAHRQLWMLALPGGLSSAPISRFADVVRACRDSGVIGHQQH
jgi:DNA-binding transcriptional LysR family regulator